MSRRRVSLLTALKLRVPKHSALLVAVSGGKDSVALLDALHRISRMLSLKLEIAHVDHGLRDSSAEDASFVQSLSEKYSLPFHLKRLQRPDSGVNIENWGRKERYRFFNSILDERKLDFVVTAHHSDDVAETFLMRLVSNKELRGIRARSSAYRILRPLLSVNKKEIEKYLRHYKLESQDDETNLQLCFLRNKIRNRLLPLLANEFQPRVAEWIAERARVLDSDARCLDKIAKLALKQLDDSEVGSIAFQNAVKDQPLAIGIRMIEFAFLSRLGFRLGHARARLVRRVIIGRLAGCDLPGGIKLYWDNQKLVLLAEGQGL